MRGTARDLIVSRSCSSLWRCVCLNVCVRSQGRRGSLSELLSVCLQIIMWLLAFRGSWAVGGTEPSPLHFVHSGDAAVQQMPVDGSAAHVAYGRGKVIVKTTCIINQSGTVIKACHSDRAGLWTLPYWETLSLVYKKEYILLCCQAEYCSPDRSSLSQICWTWTDSHQRHNRSAVRAKRDVFGNMTAARALDVWRNQPDCWFQMSVTEMGALICKQVVEAGLRAVAKIWSPTVCERQRLDPGSGQNKMRLHRCDILQCSHVAQRQRPPRWKTTLICLVWFSSPARRFNRSNQLSRNTTKTWRQ